MSPGQGQNRSGSLTDHSQFQLMPQRIQDWVAASPNATTAFVEFFERRGKFEPVDNAGLPYYRPSTTPAIVVDESQWNGLREPGASEYAQRHLFGTLAHEIGHDRYNTGNVLFKGGSADDYVDYRAQLEARAIFTAFPIFKDLENDPAFEKDFPFNSIGYLNGIELAPMYKQWRSGEQSEEAIVARIAARVPDTRFSLGNPPPDLDRDGAVTHRDAYLRDYQQLIRQRPELAEPAAERTRPDSPPAHHPDAADRTMLEQIKDGSRNALQAAGRPIDEASLDRLGHALLAECKDGRDRYPTAQNYSYASNALNRIDHVVLSRDGQKLFAVEGRLDDPSHKRAVVDVADAAQTPVAQSDLKLAAAQGHIVAEQAQSQQAPARTTEQPAQAMAAR
ncbi:XVIPCD domain-containing protein [Lysobacter enzymogenes]|uniref:XVIPCD domain-containing protein n=1 Tax=Lysobacter enzymogenes TaxID=69 RepID=UPI001115D30B|nr:XVIPCD domain-containing protein [Lysobacter enzymogenes]UZW58911.1 hypothetical protein BV903_016530 [Lysobacter enzymogenes]